jgi:hypothetical protein
MNVCFDLNFRYLDSNGCRPIKFSGCVMLTENYFSVRDFKNMLDVGQSVSDHVPGLVWAHGRVPDYDVTFREVPPLQPPFHVFNSMEDIQVNGVRTIAEKVTEFLGNQE